MVNIIYDIEYYTSISSNDKTEDPKMIFHTLEL